MPVKWKDTTSYSRGEREIPREWSAVIGGVGVCVHRHIHHAPDVWLLSAFAPLKIECHRLAAADPADAQREALAYLAKLTTKLAAAFAAEGE